MSEGIKSSIPRQDLHNANPKTAVFALGSTIYFIAKGHPPFPEFDLRRIGQKLRDTSGTGSFLEGVLTGDIVRICWAGEYESAIKPFVTWRDEDEHSLDLTHDLRALANG